MCWRYGSAAIPTCGLPNSPAKWSGEKAKPEKKEEKANPERKEPQAKPAKQEQENKAVKQETVVALREGRILGAEAGVQY